jgi:hypothetical protein
MNTMPFIYAAVPLSGMLIYVANVRRHVIADQLHKRRVTQLHRRSTGVSATNLAEVVTPKPATEHWIPLRPSTTVTVIPNTTWQPAEVPLPTYVTAAKAAARPIKEAPVIVEVAVGPDEIFDQVAIEEADLREAN